MRTVILLGLALSAAATAAIGDRFAQHWPLSLEREDSGMYRIELDASVYEASIDASLRDIAVLDARGDMQPATLVTVAATDEPGEQRISLPWFPTPPDGGPAGIQRWRVVTRTRSDASVQHVETELLDVDAAPPEHTDVLIDASQLEAPVRRLELEWRQRDTPVDAHYVLEYSDDLQAWRSAHPGARILELSNDGQRIHRNRIEVSSGNRARYFRLRPASAAGAPEFTSIHAVLEPDRPVPAPAWIALAAADVEALADGSTAYVYRGPGRFPVTSVQVRPQANSSQRWQLESRTGTDARWRRHGPPTVAYRLRDELGETLSPPLALSAMTRDREWRLRTHDAVDDAPDLLLGYHAESLVFLARGTAPYALVGGSATQHRPDAPIDDVLVAQRARHGAEWMAARARLGEPGPLAGDAALIAPAPPREYSHWIMWAVLLLGSALVAWLALGLLRRSTTP